MINNRPVILIVDDIPRNIQIIGNILKECDYVIEFATNGKDALDWLNTKRFDLVLLDVMMPEMDGFEVCEKIIHSDLGYKPEIIFITAKTETESIVKGLEQGAVDYIVKPFHKKELLARIRIHLTIIQQRHELQQANIFKSKLLSVIGHDLKDPIGSLKNYTDVFLEMHPELDISIKEFMQEASGIAENAVVLLENLLSWARSKTGTIKSIPKVTNINNIVSDSISLLTNLAKKKGIYFSLGIAENTMVYCDAELISAVLRNLISNAIKFSYPDGIVKISARKKFVSDKEILIVTVEDQGVGIKKENIQKLFGKEIHFTTYGTKNEKGSGLGLKICKEFVEISGGEIWVESKENKGTAISFTLPLKS
ncbi:MAG: hybrid sensor histidine kinase/response regulator [Bacteroidales bacterium]|nr:hybrid sensor histidine kinase/response regulator [Bacteroidales bacterium]